MQNMDGKSIVNFQGSDFCGCLVSHKIFILTIIRIVNWAKNDCSLEDKAVKIAYLENLYAYNTCTYIHTDRQTDMTCSYGAIAFAQRAGLFRSLSHNINIYL